MLGVVIIWVVAGLSALVDNVPVTIAMILLLQGLAAKGVDVSALWWAVVLGAGFGGNVTSIGSGANIVIVSLSERTHKPITPQMWSRKGLPIAIATCIVGSILFVLVYNWLGPESNASILSRWRSSPKQAANNPIVSEIL